MAISDKNKHAALSTIDRMFAFSLLRMLRCIPRALFVFELDFDFLNRNRFLRSKMASHPIPSSSISPSSNRLTKSQTLCNVFNCYPRKLPTDMLPTTEDVYCFYKFIYFNIKVGPEPSARLVAEHVLKGITIGETYHHGILDLWTKTTIPIILQKSIIDKILELKEQVRTTKRSINRMSVYQIEEFRIRASGLFDLAKCHCQLGVCSCPRDEKIPDQLDRIFLNDQRTVRQCEIGGVDRLLTRLAQKRQERINKENDRVDAYNRSRESQSIEANTIRGVAYAKLLSDVCGDETDSSDDESKDPAQELSVVRRTTISTQNRKHLPLLSLASDAFSVSAKAASAIFTMGLFDLGFITKENFALITDRSKVRREKNLMRISLKTEHSKSISPLKSLYFDARKDLTKFLKTKHQILTKMEEHMTMVKEPDSQYIGHATIPSGPSKEQLSTWKQLKKVPFFKRLRRDAKTSTPSPDEPMDTDEPTLLQRTKTQLQELLAEQKRVDEDGDQQDDDEEDWSDFGGKSIEEWLELLNDESFVEMTEDEIEVFHF